DLELQQGSTGGHRVLLLPGVGLLGRAVRPVLEGLFGLPLGVDEVPGVALDRTQQFEPEETGCVVHRAVAGGEPLLQLGTGAFRHLDRIDFHNSHVVSLRAVETAAHSEFGPSQFRNSSPGRHRVISTSAWPVRVSVIPAAVTAARTGSTGYRAWKPALTCSAVMPRASGQCGIQAPGK